LVQGAIVDESNAFAVYSRENAGLLIGSQGTRERFEGGRIRQAGLGAVPLVGGKDRLAYIKDVLDVALALLEGLAGLD